MSTPDPRPAGEMAERGIICAYCGDYTLYAETDNTSLEHARQTMMAHDAVCPRNPLVARIRELEVAAEARAALLADAPAVWVATDKNGTSRMFSAHPATIAATLQPFWGGELSLALTPPGTVRRYALVPHPEGERDGEMSAAAKCESACQPPNLSHEDRAGRTIPPKKGGSRKVEN